MQPLVHLLLSLVLPARQSSLLPLLVMMISTIYLQPACEPAPEFQSIMSEIAHNILWADEQRRAWEGEEQSQGQDGISATQTPHSDLPGAPQLPQTWSPVWPVHFGHQGRIRFLCHTPCQPSRSPSVPTIPSVQEGKLSNAPRKCKETPGMSEAGVQ